MEALFRAARQRSLRPEWTVEDCALYAARREFELLKLLSKDKKALATARRIGIMFSAGQPHSHPQGAAAAATRRAPSSQQPVCAVPRANARQRRSAERSARRHGERQRVIRSRILALLFVIRLRRRVRLRRDLRDLETLNTETDSGRQAASKRDRHGPGSGSSSDPESESSEALSSHSGTALRTHGRQPSAKRGGGSWRASLLLR